VGIIARTATDVIAVVGVSVAAGRITEIDLILDSDKFAHISLD
jgi:RNA polymerase sigma-70 factor (ECF subfamily)